MTKTLNATSYYIIRSVRRNGKNSSEIVKKLGTEKTIRETYGVDDVDAWAEEQLKKMNDEEKILLEQPHFELHQIYRALSVLADKMDFVQAELYKRSQKIIKRNTEILFYDCTNYFFELEQASGLKQYGVSREQLSLQPLEQQIMRDFELSRFVVCTDAGLSSDANRRFNNYGERSFITTQSIKKLSAGLKEWCLDPAGWHLEDEKEAITFPNLKILLKTEKKFFINRN